MLRKASASVGGPISTKLRIMMTPTKMGVTAWLRKPRSDRWNWFMTERNVARPALGRKRCRNPRCRQKLPRPTDNDHHAFCCRGCHARFYFNRCRVCEAPLRDKRGGRLYCRPPNKCRAEAQKWPHVYELRSAPVPQAVCTPSESRSAHSTGLKIGIKADRPRHRALRHWSWHSNDEHELRDSSTGTLIARLESNAGRHRLNASLHVPNLIVGQSG
jgi:hypothetical protein